MAKVGRNEPCPCGSRKKYKKCCLDKEYEERRELMGREDSRESVPGGPYEMMAARTQEWQNRVLHELETVDGDREYLETEVKNLAAEPADEVHFLIFGVLDGLAYYDEGDLLLETLGVALEQPELASIEWADNMVSTIRDRMSVAWTLRQAPELAMDQAGLIGKLPSYGNEDADFIRRLVTGRTERLVPDWNTLVRRKGENAAEAAATLLWLSVELGRRLTVEEGWPPLKAELAALGWYLLLVKCRREAWGWSGSGSPMQLLGIDRPMCRNYLGSLSDGKEAWPFRAAAMLQAVPVWAEMMAEGPMYSPFRHIRMCSDLQDAGGRWLRDAAPPGHPVTRAAAAGLKALRRHMEEHQAKSSFESHPSYLDDADVAALAGCGMNVPAGLVEKLVSAGGEAVPALNSLLHDAGRLFTEWEMGNHDVKEALWGPVHAAYVAAEIGDPSSAPHILRLADLDDENDWLHEGFLWFPTRFGSDAVPLFLDFVLDERMRWYHRATMASGVVWAAGRHRQLREQVVTSLVEAMDSGRYDAEMTTWLAVAVAATGDERALAAVERAVKRNVVDDDMFEPVEEMAEGAAAPWYPEGPVGHSTAKEYFESLARRLE